MAKRALLCGLVGGLMTCAAAVRGGVAEDAGRAAIGNLDWPLAIRIYQPLADAATPGSDAWTQATFCLAVAQQQIQPPDANTIGTAKKLFQAVADQSKAPRFVARSLMNLGRIAELKDFSSDPPDLEGARGFYRQVSERFANDPIAAEAVLREGAAYVLEYDAPDFAKVKQGIALLEKYATDHADNPLASLMWQTAGDSYFMPLDDGKNALRCYEKVDQLGWADQGNQGAWYWRAACLAERLGEQKLAIKYYNKVINETPNSGKGYSSVLALRRLGAPVPENPLFDDSPPPTVTGTSAVPATQEATR